MFTKNDAAQKSLAQAPTTLFAKTLEQKFLHCLANICPPTGMSHALKEKREKYTVEDPKIAFRADTRPPDEMHEQGFSAYSFQRILNWMTCYCISPETNGVLSTCAYLFTCLFHGVTCCCCQPGNCCGNNMVSGAHNTSWSALSFASDFSHARPGSRSNNCWRYIVLLDGAINFTEFSIDYLAQKETHHFTRHLDKFEAELLPKNLNDQTVSSTKIIAAVDSRTGEHYVMFNRQFSQWGILNDYLVKAGFDPRQKLIKIENIDNFINFLVNMFEAKLQQKRVVMPACS